jgi:hypothetical protein
MRSQTARGKTQQSRLLQPLPAVLINLWGRDFAGHGMDKAIFKGLDQHAWAPEKKKAGTRPAFAMVRREFNSNQQCSLQPL